MQESLFIAIGDSSCKTLLFLNASLLLWRCHFQFILASGVWNYRQLVLVITLKNPDWMEKTSLASQLSLVFFNNMIDFLLSLAFQFICYGWFVFFQTVWLFELNLLSLPLIIPSSCFFSCSFIMSDLSFSVQSDDWFSSFLGFSAHLLWLICLFSISLAFPMLWLIFFFHSYWLLQLQLILLWLIYLCFFGVLAQFGY